MAKQIEREVGELLVHDKVGETDQDCNSSRLMLTMSQVFTGNTCPVSAAVAVAFGAGCPGGSALLSRLSRC